MVFIIETLRLGIKNLLLHKLRSLLTALGIIIGVAAVVAIAAYGEGAKQAALRDIRQLGTKNVIVRSIRPPQSDSAAESTQRMIDYGIRRLDLRRIEESVRPVSRIVPLKAVGSRVYNGINTAPAEVFGTTPALQQVTSLRVARGRYLTDQDMYNRDNVAVIGAEVARRLFPLRDPLNQPLKVDQQTFIVVGVLQPVGYAGGAGTALVGRDLNFDIHVPMTTARSRFGDLRIRRQSGSFEATKVELHEMIVEAANEDAVPSVAQQIEKILEYSKNNRQDVTTIVPYELRRQAERTQMLFNVMMIIIAGLSLLVGGIGIMNIMLASVTERTREIGIRRALGATRRHIIAQFLVETTVLSSLGAIIGIGLGLAGALGISTAATYWPESIEQPSVTNWSIAVSFLVATTVGIVFGLYPAIQAAKQDPIVALRHE